MLLTWFKSARDNNVPFSGSFMMSKAEEFACCLGVPDGQFKCSSGWLERFKQRHGISFKCVCGKKKSVDINSNEMEAWQRTLSMLLKEYKHEDVYNADETAIFYRLLPDKTLELKNVNCHGGKQVSRYLHCLPSSL